MDHSLLPHLSAPTSTIPAGAVLVPAVSTPPIPAAALPRPPVDMQPELSAHALSKRPASAAGYSQDGRQQRQRPAPGSAAGPYYQPPIADSPVTSDAARDFIRQTMRQFLLDGSFQADSVSVPLALPGFPAPVLRAGPPQAQAPIPSPAPAVRAGPPQAQDPLPSSAPAEYSVIASSSSLDELLLPFQPAGVTPVLIPAHYEFFFPEVLDHHQ